jgi:hypothetical protein
MKSGRSYGQKYAVMLRSMKREESSKTLLNWPKKWDWNVLIRMASCNNDKFRELTDQPTQ